MRVKLTVPVEGLDGRKLLMEQLSCFTLANWSLLYLGAARLQDAGVAVQAIGADWAAPERIQVNRTRLHASVGVKYADGHKYTDLVGPSEAQLRQTINDLQRLLDAAGRGVPPPFRLVIEPVGQD